MRQPLPGRKESNEVEDRKANDPVAERYSLHIHTLQRTARNLAELNSLKGRFRSSKTNRKSNDNSCV